MVSPRRKLDRLEERNREVIPGNFGPVFGKALTLLPDKDLEALAEALDQDPSGVSPDEELDLGRLHAEAGERGRRGLDALFRAIEAVRKGGRRWG